jgi:hypothetical protein
MTGNRATGAVGAAVAGKGELVAGGGR